MDDLVGADIVETMYHDYNKILEMRSPIGLRCRMLGEVFAQNPYAWRVSGVTRAALQVFEARGWKRESKMGINRAHLTNRYETYCAMLGERMSKNQWWTLYWNTDRTVLATSSENKNISGSPYFEIDPALGLFKTRGYSWTHGKEEMQFLVDLHQRHCS